MIKSIKILERVNAQALETQNAINELSLETDENVSAYRQVVKKTQGINQYNQQLQRLIESQKNELASLNSQLLALDDTHREIGPLMTNMVEGLSVFVSLDMPFLMRERSARIENLQIMMNQAEVSLPEKYRRILMSYMIEVDYGNTIEAYEQRLELDGKTLNVEMLRVGRVALLYQTRDKNKIGFWDQNARQWKMLPKSYQGYIQQGLKVAKKQIAPNMLTIPVTLFGGNP